MLTVNELRINDLLLVPGVKYKVDVIVGIRVSGSEDEVLLAHEGWKKIKDLEPIPLRAELLAIFEFYPNKDYTYYEGRDFSLKHNQVTGAFYYERMQIMYVHQLQNLHFALFGRELPLHPSGDPQVIDWEAFL
jgi:hypothetical protein